MTLNKNSIRLLIILAITLLVGLCVFIAFVALGSTVTLWFALNRTAQLPSPTTLVIRSQATFTPSPTITPSPLPSSTLTPLPSSTASPTLTPTAPPSATPIPPTETPTSTALPPTSTPLPTETPTPPPPSFSFSILETQSFETTHLNFDVYVAITDAANKPLSGYRLIGVHNSGLQVESQVSAGDWTVNSGAKHYKGGNIKYEAFNSPSGVWTLQLVDESGQRVAPPIEFSFDAAQPTWYFILYRRLDD